MDPRVPTHDLMTRVSKLNAEPERERKSLYFEPGLCEHAHVQLVTCGMSTVLCIEFSWFWCAVLCILKVKIRILNQFFKKSLISQDS